MRLNTKEQVIKFLLSLNRDYVNNHIQVSVSRDKFNESDLSHIGENEFINQLSLLETSELITVKFRTCHRDLKYYIDIILNDPILNYFDKKSKESKKSKREFWNEFRAWITLILAILGFVLSILSLYQQFEQSENDADSNTSYIEDNQESVLTEN